MPRKNRLRYCSCCQSTVAQAIYEDHESARQLHILEADIAKLALLEPSPSATAEARKLSSTSPSKPPTTTATAPISNLAPSSSIAALDSMEMFRELKKVEEETSRHYGECIAVLRDFSSVPSKSLQTSSVRPGAIRTRREAATRLQHSQEWLKEHASRIQETQNGRDQANQLYASGLLGQIYQQIQDLQEGIKTLSKNISEQPRRNCATYDTRRYFSNPIHALSPPALLILFTAVVLNLIANITRGPCNFVLRMARLALQVATNTDSNAFPDIPQDIRTARKAFKLDPVLTVFAICSCGKLHPPELTSGPFPVYPATCKCGQKLTKIGHSGGVAIREPLRPYVMQSFTDFCARLYTRPGIEELIHRQHIYTSNSDYVEDISEACAYQTLRGPDGKRFVDCSTEIRTIWSLSYDGYNPLMNKAAGKSTSVGSLAMACISLPACLRYRPENLYLAGLIPGPRQPAADGLNPYLSPLVDQLHTAYHQGTFFERTYEHPEGIVSREALLPAINDLPAARKLVGAAGHSANILCMLCYITLPDINNIDMSSEDWRAKTTEEFRRAAQEWKNAPSKARQKALYKKNGVRWSELLRLEYWDPLQNVVVDGMHNLFLGLVRHHFREVLGTKWDENQAEYETSTEKPPSEKELAKGRKLLANKNATLSQLETLKIPALRQLCKERNVNPVTGIGNKIRKRHYTIALMQSVSTSHTRSLALNPSHFHRLEENDLNLISCDLGEEDFERPRIAMLQNDELKSIQDDIANTFRPSNQASPPRNFGSPSHGKLKADQWRACVEFDLPVSLAKLWANSDDTEKKECLESTFLLAMAIRFATSHRTSAHHRAMYLFYMRKYLESLRKLRPNDDLHPNHHNALHLPQFLESFGPLHGWWMFPFERLIGILQKCRTNFKFGELEETVMKTFCAASQLKNLMDRPSTPEVLKQAMSIMHQCLPESLKGSMLSNAGTSTIATESKPRRLQLDNDIASRFMLRGVAVDTFQRAHRHDRDFATLDASKAHSTVFFKPPACSDLKPGIIRQIFKHQDSIYLVVHLYARKHRSYFDQYPDFGAAVWSKELNPHPKIVPLSQFVYGGHLREWDENALVVRPHIRDF